MLLSKPITVLTASLLSGSYGGRGGNGLVQATLSEEKVIEGVNLESDRALKRGKVSF